MTKSVWKSKVILDKSILSKINQFYRSNLDESLVGLDCFSHPALSNHDCNPEAKLAGDTECRLCNHIFNRICPITCHLSRFCLMVFAYRIGIGGENIEEALAHNGAMDYKELNELVKARMKELEAGCAASKVKDKLQTSFPFPDKSYNSKSSAKALAKDNEDAAEEIGGEWITLKDAAELYGCSYVNIHAHVKRGNLSARELGGVKKVLKDDVLNLMKQMGR